MTSPRRVHVSVERLIADRAIDERTLRTAIASELAIAFGGARTASPARTVGVEDAVATTIAGRVRDTVPDSVVRSERR